MKRTITWLHLSDLHAGSRRAQPDPLDLLPSLQDDLRHLAEGPDGLRPDLILFTGDASFGSRDDELEEAHEFLEGVRTAYEPELERRDVFLVPGDHDVDRSQMVSDPKVRWAATWLGGQKDLASISGPIKEKSEVWSLYVRTLARYHDFLRRNGYDHLLTDPDRLVYAHRRPIGGLQVGIAGFNSAWASGDPGQKPGEVFLGSQWQIEHLQREIEPADLRIALIHHPSRWLVECEQTHFSQQMKEGFHFLLHGHEDEGWVRAFHTGLTQISAAGCYDGRYQEHGYNIVRLDLDSGIGEVWLRRHSRTTCEWRPRRVGRADACGRWPLLNLDWLQEQRGTGVVEPQRSRLSLTPARVADGAENDMATRTITWLHLSDVHFQETSAYNRNVVVQGLLKRLRSELDGDIRPQLIFFSGDLTHSGAAAEYALGRQLFDELLEITGLGKEHLFVVPGNHDINRKQVSPTVKRLRDALDSRDAITDLLTEPEDRARVLARFQEYRAFMNDYFADLLPFDDVHYFFVRRFPLAGVQIAVVGLNSAWLCADDNDERRLALGEHQVRDALGTAGDADLRIAMVHHPLHWLKEFDQRDCKELLYHESEFVLHGHLHTTDLVMEQAPDSETMVIGAGAVYLGRSHPNSYNLVKLDLTSGQGTIYFRTYSDRQGGFWTEDTTSFSGAKQGAYSFKLPTRLRRYDGTPPSAR